MATRRHLQGVDPNLDHLIVAHPRGPLLPVSAATDLFLVIGVTDSIVCCARVVIDAGGEGKREYLDADGRLLAYWRIHRLEEKDLSKKIEVGF